MPTKAWYTSKTLWVNLISVFAIVLQGVNASWVINPDYQALILGAINLILRIVTSTQLDWNNPPASSPDNSQADPLGPKGFVQIPLLLMCTSLLILGFMANGCSTTPVSPGPATIAAPAASDTALATAGKSLLAVKSTIVTAATAVDSLCKAGKIAPDKCSQAADAYGLAKPAYDAAVDAYLLWSLGHSDQAGFNAALTRTQSLAANLLALSGGAQ